MITKLTQKIGMATNIHSTATTRDWLMAGVSITPVLPCFIFVPKLIKKLRVSFDWTLFKVYSERKHKQRIKEIYDVEII